MPPKPLEPGDPLRLGRFELLGRLGEGGQGIVYLGRGTNPGEDRVAVKVLRSTVDATVLERLARELDAIHQVQPFVTAGVIEASAEGDRRFVVSEFIDGPSLQERVDTRGPLPEGDLQRLAVGTATALTAIHGAGVMHRDFKPANVLLGPDGPRVVDFGIARLNDAATITSGLIGTPSYVTPEQLAGARPTSAVDVFAWALTMIFAATGRLAFGADSVPAVMHRIMYEEPDLSGLPPSLRPIVRECLAKDPARRPSARDLLLRLVDPSAQRTPARPHRPGSAGRLGTSHRPAASLRFAVYTGSSTPARLTLALLTRLTASAGRAHDLRTRADLAPEPTRLPEPGPAPARSWRRPILAACGAAAVAALIVGGVLLLTPGIAARYPGHREQLAGRPYQQSGDRGRADDTGDADDRGHDPGRVRGDLERHGNDVRHRGIGRQPEEQHHIHVRGRRADRAGEQPGLRQHPHVDRGTATALTFSEPQTAQCVAGMVTFTRQGANLAYRWTDNIEQNVATLRKS